MSSSSQQQQQRRRELQGSRPAPLRVVHKDSHTIRKPPPQQLRQPVIIYTESPKVVHAHPADFMSVVQRLTGATSSSSSHPSAQLPPPSSLGLGPRPPSLSNSGQFPFQLQPAHHDQLDQARSIAAGGHPPGGAVLQSPMPGTTSVPAPSFFSPAIGVGGINLFGEHVDPAFNAGSTTTGGEGAAPHPAQVQYLPAAAPSPSPYYNSWDLFNNHPADL